MSKRSRHCIAVGCGFCLHGGFSTMSGSDLTSIWDSRFCLVGWMPDGTAVASFTSMRAALPRTKRSGVHTPRIGDTTSGVHTPRAAGQRRGTRAGEPSWLLRRRPFLLGLGDLLAMIRRRFGVRPRLCPFLLGLGGVGGSFGADSGFVLVYALCPVSDCEHLAGAACILLERMISIGYRPLRASDRA